MSLPYKKQNLGTSYDPFNTGESTPTVFKDREFSRSIKEQTAFTNRITLVISKTVSGNLDLRKHTTDMLIEAISHFEEL